MPTIRLGQLLVDARMLSQQALDEVLALQKIDGRRLGTLLVERGLVNETQLTQILSHQLSVPWVALLHIEFSRQLLNLVPYEVAEKYCLVPIYVRHLRGQGDTLYVAMEDPTNDEPLRECMTYSGLPVRAMIAPPSDIREAIRVCYGIEIEPPRSKATQAQQTPNPGASAEPAPPQVEPAPPEPQPGHPPAPAPTPQNEDLVRPTDVAPPTSRSGSPPAPSRPPSAPYPAPEQQSAPPITASSPPPSDEAPSVPMVRKVPLAPQSQREPAGPTSKPRPFLVDAEAPSVEAVEIDLPPRKHREPADHDDTSPPSERPAASTRHPGRGPRMVALTLLDGTTLTLPARSSKPAPVVPETLVSAPDDASPDATIDQPPPSELITALRAITAGESPTALLDGKARWETLFAALLSLLVKKRLITEAELLEELKRF